MAHISPLYKNIKLNMAEIKGTKGMLRGKILKIEYIKNKGFQIEINGVIKIVKDKEEMTNYFKKCLKKGKDERKLSLLKDDLKNMIF